MPDVTTAAAAFMVGLLGSAHCIGMCGGIVGAVTMGLPPAIRDSYLRLVPYLLLYNAGRIISYSIIGAFAGLIGQELASVLIGEVQSYGRIIAALFMIALGLYVAGWWQMLVALERAGSKLWRRIEPLGRRFLPVRGPLPAFGLGLVWGWLPCGMVYAMLPLALTGGSAAGGALVMASFGLGTLPMLFAMGSAARWLTSLFQRPRVRQAAGVLILVFGLATLLLPGGHQHNHGGHTMDRTLHHAH